LAAKGELGKALEIIRQVHETEDTVETRTLFATYLGDPRAFAMPANIAIYSFAAISEGWGNVGSGSSLGSRQHKLASFNKIKHFVPA